MSPVCGDTQGSCVSRMGIEGRMEGSQGETMMFEEPAAEFSGNPQFPNTQWGGSGEPTLQPGRWRSEPALALPETGEE